MVQLWYRLGQGWARQGRGTIAPCLGLARAVELGMSRPFHSAVERAPRASLVKAYHTLVARLPEKQQREYPGPPFADADLRFDVAYLAVDVLGLYDDEIAEVLS